MIDRAYIIIGVCMVVSVGAVLVFIPTYEEGQRIPKITDPISGQKICPAISDNCRLLSDRDPDYCIVARGCS